ncbi:hypothetical protein ACFQ05_22840 [Amycolatopsis umgeniensis]|uniref:Uncharacterized protein n=1 Tax=Amycolatopsis umgeniensis TaxID=336628 RepID=A0A841AUJ4_9PSEU|nr:hypothetical protein [Amycolatopsis umgeniensis]MBB5850045.1 hypothetical protein [Amycolatopsis umgeniensis]
MASVSATAVFPPGVVGSVLQAQRTNARRIHLRPEYAAMACS